MNDVFLADRQALGIIPRDYLIQYPLQARDGADTAMQQEEHRSQKNKNYPDKA